jgi:hypothetical protein
LEAPRRPGWDWNAFSHDVHVLHDDVFGLTPRACGVRVKEAIAHVVTVRHFVAVPTTVGEIEKCQSH